MNKIINSLKTTKSFIITSGLIVAALFAIIFPAVTNADTLYRQLQVGSRGADVSSVQTFLAQDPALYPQGLVTGYYGFLTKSAVSNFQSANGISAVGRIGPATLPVLNAAMAAGMNNIGGTIGDAAIITSAGVSNISRNSATINWYTNENAKGIVYYSTSPLSLGEHLNSVDVSGNTAMTDMNYRTNQSVTLQNLQPNTNYYYLAYVTDLDGNVSITWPAVFTTSN
jgi:peptidoglycan hydrolase-like protein with peptidoglycan-binding domain